MARRGAIITLVAAAVTIFVFFNPFHLAGFHGAQPAAENYQVRKELLNGEVVASKLGNETLR
jgi:hypothetical protein